MPSASVQIFHNPQNELLPISGSRKHFERPDASTTLSCLYYRIKVSSPLFFGLKSYDVNCAIKVLKPLKLQI